MNSAQDLTFDQFEPEDPEGETGKRLTTWYAQGHSDGLGDRLLMFDNTSAPSWEIIRFKPALARDSRFEAALRRRVEQLGTFQHSAFPQVRPIRKLGHDDGLAVVSTYASGVCLTEALKKPRSGEFAVQLLRQLVPALAALQEHAPGIAHGALSVDRILLTPEGQLMIREHMVGAAIESLQLPTARLWVEFGVFALATPTATAALDERGDIVQLALVAVSLMAGRRIEADEYPAKIRGLLDDIERRQLGRQPVIFQSLRRWIERALQIGDRPFNSARDADDALADLQDEPQPSRDDAGVPLLIAPGSAGAYTEPPQTSVRPAPVASRRDNEASVIATPGSATTGGWRRVPLVRWAVIGVGILALAEAGLIGRLLFSDSGNRPARAAKPAGERPQANQGAPVDSLPPLTPLPAAAVAKVDPNVAGIQSRAVDSQIVIKAGEKPADLAQALAASPRSGGFRVSSSIEVHVLEGERVLGSSLDGPIITAAGRHELEFVNSALGYRVRQVVEIAPGRITPLTVTVPNGSLNVNATPWANVWIDGNAYGETPLGNISVVPGDHEIVFRHPQFGERREKAFVRADALTRVSVNLQP